MNVDDVLVLLGEVQPPLSGQIRSSNVVMSCPFAAVSGHKNAVDHSPSLGILPDEEPNGGVFNCFSCGRKGTLRHFFILLAQELSFEVTKSLTRLDALLKEDPETIADRIPPYESHFAPPQPPYRTFPETWLAPYKGRTAQALLDRQISIDTVSAWQIGFDRPNQRIVYPVRDHQGRLVGAVGGKVGPRDRFDVKYKNYWHRLCARCEYPLDHRNGQYRCPGCAVVVPRERAVEGFRKARHLFGAQWMTLPAVAVVCEGVVDALAIWQATRGHMAVVPLALLGSDPSTTQANSIVNLTADRKVITFLDNDEAGQKGHSRLYELLGSRLRYFRVAYPPNEEPGGDPASLADKTPRPAEQIRSMLTNAQVVMRTAV
jgi:hypothetical protein